MKRLIFTLILAICSLVMSLNAKTLVVYYSYTNNVETIINDLKGQIECDVVEIEPAEKGLDYAANNYAIGSALIAAINNNPDDASSYPEIDQVDVNLNEYDTIIIGAPLWWSHMAAPLQTYLFQNGSQMAGKKIGLIVSSHSSGISGVVADAKRLIPDGDFLEPALWIRSSETSDCHSLISKWLEDINYQGIISGISSISEESLVKETIYTLNGIKISENYIPDLSELPNGIYILKGHSKTQKILINH